MRLNEYFEKFPSKKTVWATSHGILPSVISKFLSGKQGISLETAAKIVNATGGLVSFQDLIPNFSIKKSSKNSNKKT